MNELVSIREEIISGEKVNAVDARELHEFLEVKTPFHKWISRRIEELQLVENVDFVSVDKIVRREIGAKEQKDYVLSLDVAKHFAMMERNEKGHLVRKYFIEVEKRAKQTHLAEYMNDPLVKLCIDQAIIRQEQEKQLQMIIDNQKSIEKIGAKTEAYSANEFFCIKAYAILKKIKIHEDMAKKLGQKAARLSRRMDYPIGEVPNSTWGKVNSYHTDILKIVFEE